MDNDQLQALAEKLLEETIQNIRRLGFRIIMTEKVTKISHPYSFPVENLSVVSEEKYLNGDY